MIMFKYNLPNNFNLDSFLSKCILEKSIYLYIDGTHLPNGFVIKSKDYLEIYTYEDDARYAIINMGHADLENYFYNTIKNSVGE